MQTPESRPVSKITLLYVFFAGLWILFSDQLLATFVQDPQRLVVWGIYKGWAFVVVSAVLLWFLLSSELRKRDQVEASLRQSEERYRMLVEQAADGIFIADIHGKYIDVNTSGAAMLGYTREEIMRREVAELLPADQRSGLADRLKMMQEGQPLRAERVLQRKDGSLLPVEINAKRVSDGRLQAIVRDISDRKRSEELLRRQLRRLAALRSIDIAITSTLDTRVVYEVLIDEVIAQLQVDAAAVLQLSPQTGRLEFCAGRGFQTSLIRETSLLPGEGIAGAIVAERRAISTPDISLERERVMRDDLVIQEGFAAYHGVPLESKGRIRGVLEIFHRTPLEMDPEWLDFLETLAGQAAIAIEDAELYQSLQQTRQELEFAYDATLEGWARALELRDRETEGHSRRVTEMTLKLAQAMGIADAEDLLQIRRGSLLHDIGKMAVPDAILLKPARLSDSEWQVMRLHPQHAYEMLSRVEYLRPALDIPYSHHERWDGAGYPRGLSGAQIPLAARVFAVIDVYDALLSDRPYRSAWELPRVLQYLRHQAGRHFDPQVVERFLELVENEPDSFQ